VKIEFERGGVFEAELLDIESPKVCKGFWELLPIKLKMFQSRWGGYELYNNTDLPMNVEMETLTEVGEEASVGEISYYNDFSNRMKKKLTALMIYYGDSELHSRVNKFARITQDLEGLWKIGERIWLQGPEEITVQKLE
jgi:hypothetical protein